MGIRTGFSWLEKVFGDSSGWEGAAAFGGFGAIVAGGAYAAYLGQGGSVSAGGLAGASGLGGAYAIGEAFAGLSDPGANATYARPTGELGQGGLYYEGAGAAPPRAEGAVACPHCIGPGSFANETQYQAWLDGVWISSNVILGAASVGRWLLARVAARSILAGGAGGRHIALGLERFGLKEVAEKVGAETLMADPHWKATLLVEIGNPATRFTVSVEGLSGKTVADKVLSAAAKGAAPNASPTNWELAQLYQAGRLKDVTFVNRAAEILANPF